MDDDVNAEQPYGTILEELLNRQRQYGSSRRVAQDGQFKSYSVYLTDADKEHNAFVASLSPDQRALLARMLQEERDSAIEDAHLTALEWIGFAQEDLKYKGQPLFPPLTEKEKADLHHWIRDPFPNFGDDEE